MGGRLLALPLAFALISAAPAPVDPRTVNSDWPPAKFTRDLTVRVRFVVTQAELDRLCGNAGPTHIRAGCERKDLFGPYLVLPHPDGQAAGASSWFRRTAAHELAHAAGWNATHDN